MPWQFSLLISAFVIVVVISAATVFLFLRRIAAHKQVALALAQSDAHSRELYASLSRQDQEKTLLDKVRYALAQDLDVPSVLTSVVDGVAETFGYPLVSLYLLEGEVLVLQRQTGYSGTIHEIHISKGIVGKVARSGQPVLVTDVRLEPAFLEAMPGITSEVCVPLFDQGQVAGVLNVESVEGKDLTEADLRLMVALSEHVSIALGRARLYSDAHQRAEALGVLSRIDQAVVSDLDFEQVLLTLYDQCRQVLPMDVFYVAVYDEKTGMLYHPFFIDQEKPVTVEPRRLRSNPGLSGEVILARQTIHLPDSLDLETAGAHQIVRTGGKPTRCYVGVPLVFRDHVMGVLSMQSYQPSAYTAEQVTFFETIAYRVASAIEHARLFDEIQKSSRYLTLLNDITRAALQAIDMQTMLQTLADRVAELFLADGCFLTLWDEMQKLPIPTAAYGPFRDIYPSERATPGLVTLTASVLAAGEPLAVEDVNHSPYIDPEISARFPACSMLGLPLSAGGELLGAVLISFSERHHFTANEIEHGKQTADVISLALAKTRSAITDPLTGTHNRRGLFDLGRREIERSCRYGSPLSAILLDIDHFKQINDWYGHAVGDQVLHSIVKRCSAKVRSVDIIGRYGGEEFAILLPECDLLAACKTAERLCQTIQETPVQTDQGGIRVTASIGVAALNASSPDLDALLKCADDAMYAAKNAGRNQVMSYSQL